MYATLSNHIYNSIHLVIAFYLLFILYPKIILKPSYETKLENSVSNYILMVFFVIVVGYVLVIIKLYEFLGIFLVLLGVYIYSRRKRNIEIKKAKINYKEVIFDYVDNVRSFKKDFAEKIRMKLSSGKKDGLINYKDTSSVINTIMLIITLLYASYLRLYDVYYNAAPAMSDAYTALGWMKSISQRKLFPTGIYPKGFHIYMATLQKFAYIDSLYVLRYIGPITCVLIAFGIYFILSRITDDKTTGVIGAVIYGILISLIYNPAYSDWQRQGASNSQEFAYLFVLPTLYFLARYVEHNKKRDFITAFSGVAITALVHTVAFVFVAIGAVSLMAVALTINFKKYFNGVKQIVLIGTAATLIGVIPLAIGFLSGARLHSASESFLVEKISVTIHALSTMDYISLGCLLIAFIYIIINFKNQRNNLSFVFFAVLGVVSFLIYYMGGYITQSAVVSTRFTDFWALTQSIILGMGFYSVINILKNIKVKKSVELVLAAALIAFSIFYINPKPIFPQKMERNDTVEQYFRISSSFTPTSWMIVSEIEGYSEVMGKGYHYMLGDFLKDFNPASKKLYCKPEHMVVKTPDIFLYKEKIVYRTPFHNKDYDYDKRAEHYKALQKWVDKYKLNHSNLSVYYEDKNLIIYRIRQKTSKSETQSKIWDN